MDMVSLSSKFCKISKNIVFTDYLRSTASILWYKRHPKQPIALLGNEYNTNII